MERASRAGALRCGVARAEISPPVGVPLSGFIAREGPCAGVHDSLTATALVAGEGDNRVALVVCDVIGLGSMFVRRLRAAVERETGVPAAAQMYACTHTHGGPETGVIAGTGDADPAYLLDLEARLVAVVAAAAARQQPTTIGWERGTCDAAFNRRAPDDPAAPLDPELLVVRLTDAAGQPLATLLHYSCHPVAAGAANRLATADWCGVARERLEAAGTGPVLLVNGAAGDANPKIVERGYAAVEDVGRRVAEAALPLWQAARPEPTQGVAAVQAQTPISFLPLPKQEEIVALWAQWQAIERDTTPASLAYRSAAVTLRDHARRLTRLHWGSEPLPAYQAETQALRLGPLLIASLPGEFFTAFGQQVKAAAPGRPVLVANWTNDNLGYFPTRGEYPRGGYEVETAYRYYGYPAAWSPDSGEAVAAQAAALVRALATLQGK